MRCGEFGARSNCVGRWARHDSIELPYGVGSEAGPRPFAGALRGWMMVPGSSFTCSEDSECGKDAVVCRLPSVCLRLSSLRRLSCTARRQSNGRREKCWDVLLVDVSGEKGRRS
jgi:hypothetical protein